MAKQNKNLTKEEEKKLFKRVEKGDKQAGEIIAKANLNLAKSIAWKYEKKSPLDIDSLISAGNLGLVKAMEKFDWRKGHKFSTYATQWIEGAIKKEIGEESKLQKNVQNVGDKNFLYNRGTSNFEQKENEKYIKETLKESKKAVKYFGDIMRLEHIIELREKGNIPKYLQKFFQAYPDRIRSDGIIEGEIEKAETNIKQITNDFKEGKISKAKFFHSLLIESSKDIILKQEFMRWFFFEKPPKDLIKVIPDFKNKTIIAHIKKMECILDLVGEKKRGFLIRTSHAFQNKNPLTLCSQKHYKKSKELKKFLFGDRVPFDSFLHKRYCWYKFRKSDKPKKAYNKMLKIGFKEFNYQKSGGKMLKDYESLFL